MPISAKQTRVLSPNLGLYLDRPSVLIDERALEACLNVRIKEGEIRNENMGWDKFMATALNGRVLLIDNFFERGGAQHLIFGTLKDLYEYDAAAGDANFLTPRYETGTVDVSAADPAVVTKNAGSPATLWNANLKAGDEIHFNATGQRDPTATWYVIGTVDSDIQLTLTTAVTGAPLTNVAYTGRKLFTGDKHDHWRTETFPDAQHNDEDLWIATNGVDEIVSWDGSDTQVFYASDTTALPGSTVPATFRAKILLRHKNMMLFGDITDSGERKPGTVRNSALTKPFDITNDEASEQQITPGVEVLFDLSELGDVVVGYADKAISLMQFVGLPLVFVIRTVITGTGVIAGRAVIDFGDFHEFLASDGQHKFDGIAVTEIGTQVFREAMRQIDPARFEEVLAHVDEENGEILWVIPQNDDPTPDTSGPAIAYTEHYLENVGRAPKPIAVRDLRATATGFFERQSTLLFSDMTDAFSTYNFRWNDRFFQAAFPFNLFGDALGFIYTLGTSDQQDGADFTAFARFGLRALVDGRRKGFVRRIEPFAGHRPSAGYTLGVRYFTTDRVGGAVVQAADAGYDLTHAGRRFVNPRALARFGQPQFYTTLKDQPWELAGYDVLVEPGGAR